VLIFLNEKTASIVIIKGMRASIGKDFSIFGNGFFCKNLLNYLIYLEQNDSKWISGKNCSIVNGYFSVNQRVAATYFYYFFLIVTYLF